MPDTLPAYTPARTLAEAETAFFSLISTLRREANYLIALRLGEIRRFKKKEGRGAWTAWQKEKLRIWDPAYARRMITWAEDCRKKGSLSSEPEAEKMSASDHWYTPEPLVSAARRVLGGRFNLDPASTGKANEVVQAEGFYSKKHDPDPRCLGVDGLAHEWWAERLFLNPPWCKDTAAFVERLVSAWRTDDAVHSAIVVLNRGHAAMPWFGPLMAFPICLVHRDLKFRSPKGTQHVPRNGIIVVGMLPTQKAFMDAFRTEYRPFGTVIFMDEFEDEKAPTITAADFFEDFR